MGTCYPYSKRHKVTGVTGVATDMSKARSRRVEFPNPCAVDTDYGAITQPIQWSSEFADLETTLIYYNYRYYNPLDGRWTRRDPIGIYDNNNLYLFVKNNASKNIDRLGKNCTKCNEYIAAKSIIYASTIANIRSKCELDIKCENIDDDTLGYEVRMDNRWNPFTKIHILIVIDCCTGANQNLDSAEDTFGHELSHAQDDCYKRDAGESCEDTICQEIRTYSRGGCKGLKVNDLLTCLKDRVPSSSAYYCGADTEKMEKIVEQNFARCSKE